MQAAMRSWMFVPGNRARYIEKALSSEADVLLFDLEDGVLPEAKAEARLMLAETLASRGPGPLKYVRVNSTASEWHSADLRAILQRGLDGICIPKVESPAEVQSLATRLIEEDWAAVTGSPIRIVAAIESAAGLLAAPSIAMSHPTLVAVMFGAEDYALDLGLAARREHEAAELTHARSALVVAAAAARVVSIDGVFPNLDDPDGMLMDARRARRLGFRAKSTFNPRQLAIINNVFSPTDDEVEYATRVVAAFRAANNRGDASVALGGQLIDLPIVRRAERILELIERESADVRRSAFAAGSTETEDGGNDAE